MYFENVHVCFQKEKLKMQQQNKISIKNIKYDDKSPLENKNLTNFLEQKIIKLKDRYRILVRKSGTEKLIRIMIEGEDESKINEIADEIIDEISKTIKLN